VLGLAVNVTVGATGTVAQFNVFGLVPKSVQTPVTGCLASALIVWLTPADIFVLKSDEKAQVPPEHTDDKSPLDCEAVTVSTTAPSLNMRTDKSVLFPDTVAQPKALHWDADTLPL
jgi:hypothetical protein